MTADHNLQEKQKDLRRASREETRFRRAALGDGGSDRVGEGLPAYKNEGSSEWEDSEDTLRGKMEGGYDHQGSYTIEDYYAMEDGQRRELIDGAFYDMSSPGAVHQILLLELAVALRAYINKKKGKCRVIMAPFDVQLDQDNRTMVQPDLMVVCRPEILTPKKCFGAPDLVIEILSSSTASRDLILKLGKYQRAGVKEYWLVDPKQQRVMVYADLPELNPVVYTFTDTIPVGLWGGDCALDFAEISAGIQKLRAAWV